MKRTVSYLFLLIGACLTFYGLLLFAERYNPTISQRGTNVRATFPKHTIIPQRILIPAISVDLPIIGAKILHGKWDETSEGVSYITKSPPPGEFGNSILYGHNWPNILGNLSKIKPGDTITIRYKNIPDRIFTVQFINTVSPNQTYILKQTNDRRITLYTCTGFLDSKRLVITATLDESKNILSLK